LPFHKAKVSRAEIEAGVVAEADLIMFAIICFHLQVCICYFPCAFQHSKHTDLL
jgi:hypothetical protein